MTKPTSDSKPTSSEESKPNDGTAPSASDNTLTWGGVALCGPDEDPRKVPREEIKRRFAAAREAVWKRLREKGYLPLRTSKG